MGFLSDFEGRVGAVFSSGPRGYAEPFSFKKLARRAAREMNKETLNIDGVDYAPALFTVLVSATDDALMRPLYEQIIYEVTALVSAQAQKKNFSFVGTPLVRFMADSSLKSGKFIVFAENVDLETLEELRSEEEQFLRANASIGGAAARLHKYQHDEEREEELPAGIHTAMADVSAQDLRSAQVQPAVLRSPRADRLQPLADITPAYSESSAGLGVVPIDYAPTPVASASESTPMPIAGIADLQAKIPGVNAASAVGAGAVSAGLAPGAALGADVVGAAHAAASVDAHAPGVTIASLPGFDADPDTEPAHQAQATRTAQTLTSCILIERSTGRTFTATEPEAIIGRERSIAHIALRDPNVSRQHARLSFDGTSWHIKDLHSTNGTLVNDIDIDECALRNGDLITVGLVNLEFREAHA